VETRAIVVRVFVCREPTSPGLPLCCVYLRRNDGETKGARELYTERMQGGTKRMQGRKKRMQRMQRMTKRTMAVLQPKYWLLAVLALVLVFAPVIQMGCGGDDTSEDTTTTEQTESASGGSDLILASTTSTQDSGLFEVLLPAFEEAYPEYSVKVLAVGTGAALELGRNKDADVLLVHAPDAEKEFVANGYGTERRKVMYNDFVFVGPPSDPAGIQGMESATEALAAIAEAQAAFISRGDDSGTNKKELKLWDAAGVEPSGDWYQETGQGMGDVLRIASEKQAYTMADRATYLNLKDTLDLEILVEGDPELFNQYGVLPVTDAGNPEGAEAFADWITSPDAQQGVIAEYGTEEFGQPLFTPNAGE